MKDDASDLDVRRLAGAKTYYEVSRGQKIGDVLISIFTVPLCTLMLALVFVAVAMIFLALLRVEPPWGALVIACFMPALACVLWMGRRQFLWTLDIESSHGRSHLQLGHRRFGVRIACDDVRFLRAGTWEDRLSRRDRRAVPVLIHVDWLHRYRMYLTRDDARRCLKVLRAYCPNASAVDLLNGKAQTFLPLRRGAREQGRAQLASFWLLSGSASLGLGGIALLASMLRAAGISQPGSDVNPVSLLLAIGMTLLLTASGWYCMRKGLRLRRASQEGQEGQVPRAIVVSSRDRSSGLARSRRDLR